MSFSVSSAASQGSHADPGHQIDVADLAGMEQVSVTADLHCASRWTTKDLIWKGVRTADLVERFPPPQGCIGALAVAQYGFSANVRIEDLLAPTSLLATGRNGVDLPPEHGAPVRLVIPHLYGYKSVKWFRGWEYLLTPRRGFWEERGYHIVGDAWTGRRYSYEE